MDLPVGFYDLLHTTALQEHLEELGLLDRARWADIEPDVLRRQLAVPLARAIAGFLGEAIGKIKDEELIEGLKAHFEKIDVFSQLIEALCPVRQRSLQQITKVSKKGASSERPDTPLSVSALLTGSSRSPALRTQLRKELLTCDRADWLVSFIKYSGIISLLPALREFTRTPAMDGGPRLRIATTSYMGATDIKAIEALLTLPHTEIRVSYDTQRTRLHAKAYLFYRDTGFGSAYIGSANVSKAALDEGLEWTAKISQYETGHLWDHAVATFESHWEDDGEFTPCTKNDVSTLRKALSQEQASTDNSGNVDGMYFDLRPYAYQQMILDDIIAERDAGKRKHLIIAATGTGKTMLAAFDYKHFSNARSVRPRLLFVAHREEILKQARAAFRQVLRDGSFGDIVAGGKEPSQTNYVFCTVQSWNSRSYHKMNADFFEYIVLDEAHHASASSYQKLISHVSPQSLLGLTATPERSDGVDIRKDFGGSFTHEIRLPEAIERALLSPFHYFGIPDLDGLDFSTLAWKRGAYDRAELRNRLEGNRARAQWVMGQTESYVSNMSKVRGLGFCVSIAHARFMEQYCMEHGIAAMMLSGESSKEERRTAQIRLESRDIQFIFTVDLYNEGIDIPSVDVVMFLRPTESLTIFLQQLGRGLRLHPDKSHLTVLDFIAPQHRRFSYAKRFQALTSRPELRIDKQIESDLPYVPAGCLVHLESQAKEHVLQNIRAATANLRGEGILQELRALREQHTGHIGLQDMINFLHLDSPDEIYKRGLPHVLLSRAQSKKVDYDSGFEEHLAKGFRRFTLMDDPYLIENAQFCFSQDGCAQDPLIETLVHSVLWGTKKPGAGTVQQVREYFSQRESLRLDMLELLEWMQSNHRGLIQQRVEGLTGPLNLHASYTRSQILLALGLGSFDRPKSSREGVVHVPGRKVDAFFADINKSESDFSPTTMYEDYAITDKLFHWQSQSQTSASSDVGLRYINHNSNGYVPLLFIRDRKKLTNGLTAPYVYAGPLKYKKHSGSKPISFVWELEHALPAKTMMWASRV